MQLKSVPILLFFPFVCSFLFLPADCLAGRKLIAVTEIWPPFRIVSAESKHGFIGIDIDILEGLEKYLDLDIEIQRHPFARALEMIKAGDADLISGVAYTDKRGVFIDYVPTSYYIVHPVFYSQKNYGHLVKKYDDLYKFEVGYSLNSAYFEPFNSDFKLHKVGISTEEQLIKMVALGRIDLIIGTNPNLAYDIKRLGFKDKVEQAHFIPQHKTPVFIGLSKKHNNKNLQQKIDTYLKQIIDNGELEQILKKYQ